MQLLYLTLSAGTVHGRHPYHRNLKASKGDKQRHETSHPFTIFASCTCAKTPNNPGALCLSKPSTLRAAEVPLLLQREIPFQNVCLMLLSDALRIPSGVKSGNILLWRSQWCCCRGIDFPSGVLSLILALIRICSLAPHEPF